MSYRLHGLLEKLNTVTIPHNNGNNVWCDLGVDYGIIELLDKPAFINNLIIKHIPIELWLDMIVMYDRIRIKSEKIHKFENYFFNNYQPQCSNYSFTPLELHILLNDMNDSFDVDINNQYLCFTFEISDNMNTHKNKFKDKFKKRFPEQLLNLFEIFDTINTKKNHKQCKIRLHLDYIPLFIDQYESIPFYLPVRTHAERHVAGVIRPLFKNTNIWWISLHYTNSDNQTCFVKFDSKNESEQNIELTIIKNKLPQVKLRIDDEEKWIIIDNPYEVYTYIWQNSQISSKIQQYYIQPYRITSQSIHDFFDNYLHKNISNIIVEYAILDITKYRLSSIL
jgi:hypothetical protein